MLVPSKTVYSRERKDVLAFMLEMCNTAKAVMQTVRMKFFRCVPSSVPRPSRAASSPVHIVVSRALAAFLPMRATAFCRCLRT